MLHTNPSRGAWLAAAAAAAALAAGCRDPSPGAITVTAYGEAYIEEGIPAAVFSDGWAVAFDSYLVSIGGVAAKAGEGSPEVGEPGFFVVDLARPSAGAGIALATFDAPGGTYDHFGYRVAPAADATPLEVAAADADAMKAAGYAIWIRGTATKDAVTKTFDWGFPARLAYAHCEVDDEVDGGTVTMQATIHADHLFYDDAVSSEPNVAFQLVADADGADGTAADGAIAMAELAAIDIRAQQRYQVGSNRDPAGAPITTLAQYLAHQATTVGHVNGEGHCAALVVAP